MQKLYKTVYSPNKKLKTKYDYNRNIDWIPEARLCLITQNIHFNRIERKLGTNLGVSSILATLWTKIFKFYMLVINFEFFFSFRCLGNWTKFIVSYPRRLKVEKSPAKIRLQFLKKTVYFKNCCVWYLNKKTAEGPDIVAC